MRNYRQQAARFIGPYADLTYVWYPVDSKVLEIIRLSMSRSMMPVVSLRGVTESQTINRLLLSCWKRSTFSYLAFTNWYIFQPWITACFVLVLFAFHCFSSCHRETSAVSLIKQANDTMKKCLVRALYKDWLVCHKINSLEMLSRIRCFP